MVNPDIDSDLDEIFVEAKIRRVKSDGALKEMEESEATTS